MNSNNNNGATAFIAAIGVLVVFGLAVSYGSGKNDPFGADGRYDRKVTEYTSSIKCDTCKVVGDWATDFFNPAHKRNDTHIQAWKEKERIFREQQTERMK